MTDERKQIQINWTSGDENIVVEWRPLDEDIRIQDGLEEMYVYQSHLDDLIKALRAIKEKIEAQSS